MEYYTKDHEHELKANSIASLRPGAQWSMMEGKLEWLDDKQTQPTESEIEAEGIRLEAESVAQEYARNRKAEYDALNQLELISDDTNNGTTTHIDAVNAIKAKYPKPE
jgi:hypothetical protein